MNWGQQHVRSSSLCAFAAAVSGLTCACAADESKPPAPPVASVQALIGEARCESDTQCATIGVGAKACGGPDAYLPWSSATADAAAVRSAAQRQTEADRKLAATKGMVSTCDVRPDPGAFCDLPRSSPGAAGICRLRNTRTQASPLIR
jgi:hypothetical protein